MSKDASQTLVCPTCKRRFSIDPIPESMPFCSAKCRLIDLGRWLDEDIGIPHAASDTDEEEDQPPEPPPVREWRFD